MNPPTRKALALRALHGTAIGDAFGEQFFGERNEVLARIEARTMPAGSWEFTDDTVMAIAVYHALRDGGHLDQDRLAAAFARNYALDDRRGYGGTAHGLLRAMGAGEPWQAVSQGAFDGMGSMGNGAAMRVAPLGAYHWDATQLLADQARASAVVTHAHLEAQAGAIAVALATAQATRVGLGEAVPSPADFITAIAGQLPECDTKYKVAKAATFGAATHVDTLVAALGNGLRMTAQDTVPIALWVAAHNLRDYEEALWTMVAALGDRDTLCAIVGGIVVMSAPAETVPQAWRDAVERVEDSVFWEAD